MSADKKYDLVPKDSIYEPGNPLPLGLEWERNGFAIRGPHFNIILDASEIKNKGIIRIHTSAPYRGNLRFELVRWHDGLMTYRLVEEEEPTFGKHTFKGQSSHD